MPVSESFQFDTDEGQELIKASLYSQGFSLYDRIWSDQPPLLALLLSFWFRCFGQSVFSARLLILSFSTILVWSFCNTIRNYLGGKLAAIATLLLCLSCNFLRLSVSVMIGMPSLALAMLSTYLLVLYQKQLRFYTIFLSGILFATSLQMKMFTIFLVPLLLLTLWDLELKLKKDRQWKFSSIYSGLVWLVSLIATFLFIGLLLNSLDLNSIFQFHLQGDLKDKFVRENSWRDVALMFLQELDYFLLAMLGIGAIARKKSWLEKLPLLWLGMVIIILVNHKPVWYHHYLLISIPLTWLATYGISVAIAAFNTKNWQVNLKKRNRKGLAIALCLFAVLVVPIKFSIIQIQNANFVRETQPRRLVVENIQANWQGTPWIFTDNPIYAFYAGLNVPPEIATLSRKRVASGEMTREYLTQIMDKYAPEQVILERFPEVLNALQPYLDANYLEIEKRGTTHHYLRKPQNEIP